MRIDFHTHVFPETLPPFAERFGDQRWPKLEKDGPTAAKVMVEGSVYRRISDACWTIKNRLEDMEREDVTHQVISPTPILLSYWGKPEEANEFCRYVNDFVAGLVKQDPKR